MPTTVHGFDDPSRGAERRRLTMPSLVRAVGILTVLAAFGFAPVAALAATYYVDPAGGNDANAGTLQTAPWKTIPGTRTVNSSGWLRTAWGGITTTAKLSAGDTINIKAGTTMSSSVGGKLLIDSSYYNNGTLGAPIVIQVSATWGTGNFIYDGTGITEGTEGLVRVASRNYIQIRGGSGRRFVVRNAPAWGVFATGTSGTHQVGIVFDYFEIDSAVNGGLSMSYSNDWTVSNSVSHDNGQIGFTVGGISDQASVNGTFSDTEAYGNGTTDNGSGIQHGFGLYGSTNISYIRCTSHNNGRDGFDFGTTSNASDSSATVVDSSSYDNGEDGFAANGGSGTNLFTYINAVAYNNQQAGWNIYAGAETSLYNCIAHHNGNQTSFGGNFMINSEYVDGLPAITKAVLRNCIGYKPRSYANVYSYNSSGLVTTIDSDYNIFVPRSANTEVFAETPFGSQFTYTNKPSWVGAHDKVGIAYAPNFVAVSTASFALNDYHLATGTGAAINAGVTITGVPSWVNDRDGRPRANPPEIGPYEYGAAGLAAPKNLRIVP